MIVCAWMYEWRNEINRSATIGAVKKLACTDEIPCPCRQKEARNKQQKVAEYTRLGHSVRPMPTTAVLPRAM